MLGSDPGVKRIHCRSLPCLPVPGRTMARRRAEVEFLVLLFGAMPGPPPTCLPDRQRVPSEDRDGREAGSGIQDARGAAEDVVETARVHICNGCPGAAPRAAPCSAAARLSTADTRLGTRRRSDRISPTYHRIAARALFFRAASVEVIRSRGR
jgi:hypothetical protein